MSLWDNIADGAKWLGGKVGEGLNWVGDQFQKGWQPIQNTVDSYKQGSQTPEDYKNAYENANKSLANQTSLLNNQTNLLGESKGILDKQRSLNNLYTGNKGYQNTITQGLQGANVLSGKAGNEALQAARNAGMTKAQAAALGTGAASNAFGNNFMNQQQMAAQRGMDAVSANQGLSGQYGNLVNQYGNQAGMYGSQSGLYGNLANMAQGEAQRKYGNSAQQIGTAGNVVGNLFPMLTALSDERMKNIKDQTTHISDLASKLNSYLFEYKPEAQEEYGVDDKEHVGVMAQEMEKNPITASNVIEDENGIKHIDTNQQTLTNLALIADLARRLADLEEDKQ